MRIVDLKTRIVEIPVEASLQHSTGVYPGYLLRTIIELRKR